MLRPVDEAARQTLQATFDDVMKMRKDVLDTLLTTTADREMFRKVYPFSPALVQTLIAVSAALPLVTVAAPKSEARGQVRKT